MIKKVPCEAGCNNQKEMGDVICKRCFKAAEIEVESPQEQLARIRKEESEFIAMAEEGRERILSRNESLSDHNKMLVLSYFGAEYMKRGYPSPLTSMGRALSIILLSEAMVVMVPEAEKPWMVDGKATDIRLDGEHFVKDVLTLGGGLLVNSEEVETSTDVDSEVGVAGGGN